MLHRSIAKFQKQHKKHQYHFSLYWLAISENVDRHCCRNGGGEKCLAPLSLIEIENCHCIDFRPRLYLWREILFQSQKAAEISSTEMVAHSCLFAEA